MEKVGGACSGLPGGGRIYLAIQARLRQAPSVGLAFEKIENSDEKKAARASKTVSSTVSSRAP